MDCIWPKTDHIYKEGHVFCHRERESGLCWTISKIRTPLIYFESTPTSHFINAMTNYRTFCLLHQSILFWYFIKHKALSPSYHHSIFLRPLPYIIKVSKCSSDGWNHTNIDLVMIQDTIHCITLDVTSLLGRFSIEKKHLSGFLSAYFLSSLCSFRNFLGWLAGWLTQISSLIGRHTFGLRRNFSLAGGFYRHHLLVIMLAEERSWA